MKSQKEELSNAAKKKLFKDEYEQKINNEVKKRLQQLNREPTQPRKQEEPQYIPQTVPKPIRRPVFC